MHVSIVLTCRVQGLCDSQVCDAKYDSVHILKKSLNFQVMVQWHIPINSITTQYGLMEYIPSMLRGMDVFPTLCHYDTRGHGRAVLRHAPQVVVMMMVGGLLGEARSTSQPMLPLSGSVWEGQCNWNPLCTRRGRKGRMQT